MSDCTVWLFLNTSEEDSDEWEKLLHFPAKVLFVRRPKLSRSFKSSTKCLLSQRVACLLLSWSSFYEYNTLQVSSSSLHAINYPTRARRYEKGDLDRCEREIRRRIICMDLDDIVLVAVLH